MPLVKCKKSGIWGWKWGLNNPTCFIGKDAKKRAIKQALAITKGKMSDSVIINDSINSKAVFKIILNNSNINKTKKIKTKGKMIYPSAIERNYFNYIKNILNKFIEITNTKIITNYPLWLKQNKQEKENTFMDDYVDDFENITNEFYNLQNTDFLENKSNFGLELTAIGLIISEHSRKELDKLLRQTLGVLYNPYESWMTNLLRLWTKNNVNLIKGLSDEYIKKIVVSVINAIDLGTSAKSLSKQLLEINNSFGLKRSMLIARDQISKLNSQIIEQRQRDLGIETYIWETAKDERVRPSHKVLQGKLCRWDDPTVYSDDNGKTWKSRSTIGGILLHPGMDIACRCIGQPNFQELVDNLE